MSAEKNGGGTLTIKQIRSGIGNPREMRETLKALGLRKIHQTVERTDTREIRGMIAKVHHLVEVTE
jgi:large subunit ribosomal protein L30